MEGKRTFAHPSGRIGVYSLTQLIVMNDGSNKSSRWGMMVLVLVVVVVVAAAVYWKMQDVEAVEDVNKDAYHAVFLSNNQVYFAKIADVRKETLELTDIYYLQVNQQIQPVQQEEGETAPAENRSQFSLVKLGNEIHGPTDRMVINREQVLFYEELKSDSRVTKAIEQYKSGQTTTNTNTSTNQ